MSDPNKKNLCPICKTWYYWHPATHCDICEAKINPKPQPQPAKMPPGGEDQDQAYEDRKQWIYDQEDSQFQDRFVSGPGIGY